MGSWNLCEARLRQKRTITSAANSDQVSIGPVPAGKIWVVLAVGYLPSVAETQTISFHIYDASHSFGILNPLSMALNPARATCIEQGMELMMWPGECICVVRGDHTAGSTMWLVINFVEIDLPLYTYEEPQVVKRQIRAISTVRQMISTRAAGIPRPATRAEVPGEGGGGSRSLPK